MDFVFFKCNELDQQPEYIQKILSEGENVVETNPIYMGIGDDNKQYHLQYDNIQNDNCIFSLKDPNKAIVPRRWKRVKQINKIKRDTSQSEDILYKLGIMPFKGIYKRSHQSGKTIWSDYQAKDASKCDFFALMIDKEKGALAGIAKAYVNKPGSDTYEVPLGSDIFPNTIDYIYISEVDIHPNYIGKGYCRPLVTFIMNKISELSPSNTHFSIDNASLTEEGIPACVCYVKSGTDNGYDVYYGEYNTEIFRKMTPELCYTSNEETRLKMPDMYYYVKKGTKGGKRKKKKKTQRKKGKKNNRKTRRK